MTGQTASGRYLQLSQARSAVLERGRASAKLTIPSLLPSAGHSESSSLPTPFQGIGARGINNLASKLLLALLPPNSPFFRLMIDDFTLENLTKRKGMRAEVEKGLNKIERALMTEIETTAIRVSAFEALKQLLVAGNVLIYLPTEGGMRVFRLDRYVVKRDPMGNVIEIITREDIAPDMVPEAMKGHVKNKSKSNERTIELYTHIVRQRDRWTIRQEIKGMTVPQSRGSYPLDKCPWIPLRFTKIDCEDYGRGYVEEYYGDLLSLETLTQAIVEGSAAAAKVLFLVNPNGTTRMTDIAKAPSGAVRAGNAEDVSVLQLDKFADFKIASETINNIQQRLSFAFLLNTAIQRAGERVTAEEIRYMAGELEDALGGVYSILSQEFQLPLVRVLMFRMEQQKKIPPLPKGVVKPTITTGLEALGRGHDMNKLTIFAQTAANAAALPPELSKADFLTRVGTALGIDMDGLVKTPEQLQQDQQTAMMQQLLDRLGPKGMDILRDQLKPEVQNGPQAQAQ
ncbi:portal protein [Rhizobium sp. IMFF44]|uniref:portal protein n=1 Tax=Rhizobium sp. IMFF44 TaxID=3342350 RepID=UPI0035B77C79